MKGERKNLKDIFFYWPSAVSLGVAIALYFGIFLSFFYKAGFIQKSIFFSTYPNNTRIILGAILLSSVVFSLLFPEFGGLASTYIICVSQIGDSIIVHQYSRIGVWAIILGFATWGMVQKSHFFRYDGPHEKQMIEAIRAKRPVNKKGR